jgi:NADPH2:quinone reductase
MRGGASSIVEVTKRVLGWPALSRFPPARATGRPYDGEIRLGRRLKRGSIARGEAIASAARAWETARHDDEENAMKAAVLYEGGGPEVLKYEDVPDPVCRPKGVVIKVEAISIEGGDTLARLRGMAPKKPHIVGYQAGGTIIEVGSEVTNLKVGQKVATTDQAGSHAELRAVAARSCWLVPEGLDVKKACVVPVPFGTADDCLFEFGHLKAGETVLITAAASGVGVAAIQLAKRAGAKVIGAASSDERLEQLKPLGLDIGINYKTKNMVEEVRRITDNKGVNLVVDGVGGSTLQNSLMCLAHRGRCCFIGAAGREPNRIDISFLMMGDRSLTGVYQGAELGADRGHDNVQRLIDDVGKGELKVIIDREFPLKEAAAAHAYIESRKAVGRVLLIP